MNETMRKLINEAIDNIERAIDEIEGNLSESQEYKKLSDISSILASMTEEE